MCRFVAVVSKDYFDPGKYVDYLENMAKKGKRAEHGDGWGIWVKSGSDEFLHKETVPVWERKIKNFPRGNVAFIHARKRGENGAKIAIENTHPFTSHGSVFMHNGFINITHEESCGDTDSESLFMNIIHRGLWNVLCEIEKYDFSSINSVLYTDGKIYVIRYAKKLEDYYSIFIDRTDDRIVISTEGDGVPVNNKSVVVIDDDLNIEELPFCPDMFH